MPDAEHVLGVDGRVVGRAAGGDDDVIDRGGAQPLDEWADDVGGGGEEPGRDVGLFQDLVAQRGHAVIVTGSRPVALARPASTSARAASDGGRIE